MRSNFAQQCQNFIFGTLFVNSLSLDIPLYLSLSLSLSLSFWFSLLFAFLFSFSLIFDFYFWYFVYLQKFVNLRSLIFAYFISQFLFFLYTTVFIIQVSLLYTAHHIPSQHLCLFFSIRSFERSFAGYL